MPMLPTFPPRARLAGAITLITTLAASSAQAQVYPPPQNVLSLSADASAEVVQDLLTITLQVSRDGTEAGPVQTQLRQVLDAALAEARKSVRAGQLEVRTGAFALYPRYTTPKPGTAATLNGWQGRAELVLEGRDIAAISQLAGRLSGPGAGSLTVGRVAFGLSPEARTTTEAEVAARAIDRFKARAETYARQFGFGGYSLREVSVGGGEVAAPAGPPMMRMARVAAAPMADESQPVEAGKATVSVTVNGSIQLSPR